MSFKELRDRLIEADKQAMSDWDERENDWSRGSVGIEERIMFVECRRSLLGGAIQEMLSKLIEQEERGTETNNE